MFDARSVKRLVILLLVLAAGGIAVPSMAQMGGGIERSIVSNAVQNATQSARDQQKGGAASKTAKADTKAKSAPELAGVQSKEAKKPTSRAPQQTTRNPSGIPPAGEQRYEPNEVVIEVTSSMTSQQIGALVRRFRLTNLEQVNFQLGGTTLVRLRIPDRRTVTNVVRALETDTGVLFAQPNYLYALIEDKQQATSSGEADPPEYMPAKVRLKEAHQLARGSKVLVAVIDSGIDVSHPDLAGDIVNTFDAIGVGEKVHLHGTAIAGGIAAHGKPARCGTGRADPGRPRLRRHRPRREWHHLRDHEGAGLVRVEWRTHHQYELLRPAGSRRNARHRCRLCQERHHGALPPATRAPPRRRCFPRPTPTSSPSPRPMATTSCRCSPIAARMSPSPPPAST